MYFHCKSDKTERGSNIADAKEREYFAFDINEYIDSGVENLLFR